MASHNHLCDGPSANAQLKKQRGMQKMPGWPSTTVTGNIFIRTRTVRIAATFTEGQERTEAAAQHP
jgi:hypothetical protein